MERLRLRQQQPHHVVRPERPDTRIDDDYDGGRGPLAKRTPSAASTPTSPVRASDPAAVNGMCDAAWVAAHPPPKKPMWQRVLGYAAVAVTAAAGATFCAATAGLGCLAIAAGATAAVSFGNNWAIQEQPAGQAALGAAVDGALMFAGGTLGLKAAESFAAARSLASSGVGSGATAGTLAGTGRSAAEAALGARANALHSALDPIAQNSRTTAALSTRQATTVLAGGGRDLSPAQRALARAGEIVVRNPGAHAEVTAVRGAQGAGLAPQGIGVSRPICQACQAFLEESGATLTSPTTAWWFGG